MEIYTFRRILFPTHVGTSETNDNYIYIPKNDMIIDTLFLSKDTHSIEVIDKFTGKVDTMLVSYPKNGAECRIAGQFAIFVRRHNLTSGDEVIFERIIYDNGVSRYYVSFQKHQYAVTTQYRRKLNKFTLENPSRISMILESLPSDISVNYRGNMYTLKITDGGMERLKTNSPELTKTFNIYGYSEMGVNNNSFILEHINENEFRGKDFIPWSFTHMKESNER